MNVPIPISEDVRKTIWKSYRDRVVDQAARSGRGENAAVAATVRTLKLQTACADVVGFNLELLTRSGMYGVTSTIRIRVVAFTIAVGAGLNVQVSAEITV